MFWKKSVVFHRSARKMTPEITLVGLVSAICLFDGLLCATYSNVFVRGGSEIVPLEYIKYGGPVGYAGPQIAQLSTAPIESVVSLQNALNPCAAPCVINSPIPALAPITSAANAQIVAYKAPANVPFLLANQDDPIGYQYAYAVYDEGTGDKKTQSEQSDGSVVQGQYSFIQPDGYRREVVYTADDLKGFNAIVKTILPEPVTENKEALEESTVNIETPCSEPKKEQLVEAVNSEEKTKESVEEVTEAIENIETKSEEKSSEEVTTPTETPADPEPNVVVSYSDFINCLQSKRVAGAKAVISPLTYVLIPSLNGLQKSC